MSKYILSEIIDDETMYIKSLANGGRYTTDIEKAMKWDTKNDAMNDAVFTLNNPDLEAILLNN